MEEIFTDLSALKKVTEHPISKKMDELFSSVLRLQDNLSNVQISIKKNQAPIGDAMSDNDKELSLDELGELELGSFDDAPAVPTDAGMELSLDDEPLKIVMGDDGITNELDADAFGDLSLDDPEDESESEVLENLGDLNLSLNEPTVAGLELHDNAGDKSAIVSLDDSDLDFSMNLSDEATGVKSPADLSDDARKKLQEIDAIMDLDASNVGIVVPQAIANEELSFESGSAEVSLDFTSSADAVGESLVSDDLNLDSLDFSAEEAAVPAQEVKPKKKKQEASEDFKEISGAYSGEMERTQATIANLRADRGELLAKIQNLEEDKVLHNRQSLTLRAELDERKIELTIIRKKLNEELSDLKDRMRMQEERKLILEEKNRLLTQELDKAGQKNKIDIKKVQMRERDLEQKLELLKSDAETQIKNRDLKILELKRKIDSMEFDMDSISQQEKRSVENRFELEDKLDKAIKTLRSAISVLEDETDRGSALEALKKNIDV